MSTKSITYVSGKLSSSNFPAKLSNQVFFSENSRLNLTYQSIYSIKYQITGNEEYMVHDDFYRILPNHYLIVNNEQDVTCIESKSGKAISIFLEPQLLNDVFFNSKKNNEELLANPYEDISNNLLFFEESYRIQENVLSKLLRKISVSFDQNKKFANLFNSPFFYKVAEALIYSQQETMSEIKRIDCIKRSTKDELFRRVNKAKEIIIENWASELTLDIIAKQVYLSPYHFHRTFTSIYGIPPLKFHKIIRMQKSKNLLELNSYSVSEVAVKSGYENLYSFSKAFKKHFNVSPTHYCKS